MRTPSDESIDALLTALERLARVSFASTRRAADIPVAEYVTLGMIADDPGVTASRIAERRGLNRSTSSRQLRALADRGLIQTTHDGARVLLHVSDHGRALVEATRATLRERTRARVAEWDAERVHALADEIGSYLQLADHDPSAETER